MIHLSKEWRLGRQECQDGRIYVQTAGYITEEDINPIHRLKYLDQLNDDDMIQLQEYINFLLFKKTENEPKKGKV